MRVTGDSMLGRFGKHLRGNAVAYVALFFAMSGVAQAAFIITSGSQVATGVIGTRAIQDGSIRQPDLAVAEPWHVVGASGQPTWTTTSCSPFICEFKNLPGGPTEFYKDPYGVVHLRMNVCYSSRLVGTPVGSGACNFEKQGLSIQVQRKIFTLPSGYRPANNVHFSPRDDTGLGLSNDLLIGSGGSVLIQGCVDCWYRATISSQEFSFRAG